MAGSPATLLADIGGTNARFSIFAGDGYGKPVHFATADFATPEDAILAFLAQHPGGVTKAVIAAAGPLRDGRIAMTNAPWVLDAKSLAAHCGFNKVALFNDFAAQGWAIPALTAADLRQLGGGSPAHAPAAIFGAGTGFGLAIHVPGSGNGTVIVTEGGHASLVAETAAEEEILRELRKEFGHVSIERVFSGAGLEHVFKILARRQAAAPAHRPAHEIASLAAANDCSIATDAAKIFCGWLGAVASDIALTTGAQGGIYMSGSVIRGLATILAASEFRRRFENKGRLQKFLAPVPVFIVLHDDPAFLGLAHYAVITGFVQNNTLGPIPEAEPPFTNEGM
jgi:glucokinase